MKSFGYPVSIALHVAVLVAAVVSLPATQPLAPAEESLPVEILTPEEFSAITKGEKTAKPKDKPEVKVDKVAAAEVDDDNPAEAIKREAVATPPPPRPKSLEPETPEPPKPVVKAEPAPEPEPKPAQPIKPDPPKPDPPKPEVKVEPKPEPEPEPVKPIDRAESEKLDELALKALEEDEPKPEKEPEQKPEPKPAKPVAKPAEKPAKVAEPAEKPAKVAEPAEKPAKVAEPAEKKPSKAEAAEPSRNFDPSRISALLSKEAPARKSRSDAQASATASLGSSRGVAPKLSLSQRSAIVGAIMNHVSPCWSPPSFAQDASGLDVLVAVDLNEDGTLATDPQIIKYPANKSGSAAAGAAMRAIKRCVTAQTPLKLPPNLYASWREIEINFDPRQMAGG